MVRDAVGRAGSGWIPWSSFGNPNAATAQECVHPLEPRSTFHEGAVVGVRIEPLEVPTSRVAEMEEKVVEDLSPGRSMKNSAVREYTVEVEEACSDSGRKAEHLLGHRNIGEPGRGADAG